MNSRLLVPAWNPPSIIRVPLRGEIFENACQFVAHFGSREWSAGGPESVRKRLDDVLRRPESRLMAAVRKKTILAVCIALRAGETVQCFGPMDDAHLHPTLASLMSGK